MFQGAFKPEGLISLVIGIICVLVLSRVGSNGEDLGSITEEPSVEANE